MSKNTFCKILQTIAYLSNLFSEIVSFYHSGIISKSVFRIRSFLALSRSTLLPERRYYKFETVEDEVLTQLKDFRRFTKVQN